MESQRQTTDILIKRLKVINNLIWKYEFMKNIGLSVDAEQLIKDIRNVLDGKS